MAVLTREEILKEIHQKTIEIVPFEEDQVGSGSIDLRLGNEFRVFKKLRNACISDLRYSLCAMRVNGGGEKDDEEIMVMVLGNHNRQYSIFNLCPR